MDKPEINDSIEYKESLISQDKEKIWSDTFGSEYKPDCDHKDSFLKIKDDFYDVLPKSEKKIFMEIFSLLEGNNYRLDINFLESLNINQKKYLSGLLYDIFKDIFHKKFETTGKSLFIRIYRWKECNGGECDGDRHILLEIAENFEGFNVDYFRQSCNYLRCIGDKDIFHVLQEYNLIKNLDNDIKSPEIKDSLNLGEHFSLGSFHARSDLGYGREKKYGLYELDSKGQETKLSQIGEVSMLEGKGDYIPYAYVLDRNDESVYKDASGEIYNEYLDSPAGIALFYKGKPVACISFYIKNGNELFINQIQKVVHYDYDRYGRCTGKHYSKIINEIDWKNVLYNITTVLAKKYNISRIIIQGGENNRWIKEMYKDYETDYFRNCVSIYIDDSFPRPNREKPHLDPEIAYQIYDVFAQGLGFKKNEDGNREKEI